MNPTIQELFPAAILRNTVGQTENYTLDINAPLPTGLMDIMKRVDKVITPNRQTYATIQDSLRREFGYDEVVTTVEWARVRVALALGMPGTAIIREESTIILPWDTDTPRNNTGNIVDPLGWASRVMAPGENYGLWGKISDARPGNPLYDTMMKTLAGTSNCVGYAIEFTRKNEWIPEVAIMPTYRIEGGRELIMPYSQTVPAWSISTAKHILINQ